MRLSIRLLGLLVLVGVAAWGAVLRHADAWRQASMAELQRTALHQANLVAAALDQLSTNLTHSLAALERAAPAPRSSDTECQWRLQALQVALPHAVEVSVRQTEDRVSCAAARTRRAAASVATRPASAPPALELAWPLRPRDAAEPPWTAYAKLDLVPWENELLKQIRVRDGRLLIADQDGRIVLEYPPHADRPTHLPPRWHTPLHATASGSLARTDWLGDGPRTVGFIPAGQSAHGLFIAVGLDAAPTLARMHRATAQALALITLALAALGLAIWALGYYTVTLPQGRILSALRAWQSGDPNARARTHGQHDLAVIGHRLDALLDQLQARDMQSKHTQHALRAARDAAIAASVAKTRFMASASHDLRQPLHALTLTVAALANQCGPTNTPHPMLITRLKRGVATLTELVEALLDLSRLDAGQIKPEWATVALPPLLQAVAEEFRPLAEAQGLSLEVAADALNARTDGALLRTMLRNLVANAIKFTPAGGRVDLQARVGARGIAVAVRDTGIGIPPERHADIFEEFRQLDNPQRLPGQGLGLGLNIVKRLSELLNHPVTLDSTPGAGATFTLWLPVAPRAPTRTVQGP